MSNKIGIHKDSACTDCGGSTKNVHTDLVELKKKRVAEAGTEFMKMEELRTENGEYYMLDACRERDSSKTVMLSINHGKATTSLFRLTVKPDAPLLLKIETRLKGLQIPVVTLTLSKELAGPLLAFLAGMGTMDPAVHGADTTPATENTSESTSEVAETKQEATV